MISEEMVERGAAKLASLLPDAVNIHFNGVACAAEWPKSFGPTEQAGFRLVARAALTAALSDQVVVPSVEQFISDMADSVNEVKATEKQKEIFKASLRFAISHARRKASQRTAAPPPSSTAGEG